MSSGTGRRRRRHRKRQQGGDLRSVLGKVNSFFKEHKVISRAANALGGVLPGRYGAIAKTVGSTAEKLGYGRRRKRAMTHKSRTRKSKTGRGKKRRTR